MENNLDYQTVPTQYAHCFNSQCVISEKCLRHLVAKSNTSQYPTLQIINPNCIPEDTACCKYFQPIRKERLAWGFKKIFDNVPHKYATAMRQQIISHFGKTAYYRFYRHKYPLMPEDQAYICQVFKQNGIMEEPKFDKYTDEYIFK